MNILYSLPIAILFVAIFGKLIKKYPIAFYVLAIAIGVVVAYVEANGIELGKGSLLARVNSLFVKGAISTIIFMIVMYTGALNPKWKLTKALYRIRGELSIIASFLILSHNISFGLLGKRSYLIKVFSGPSAFGSKPQRFYVAIITMILVIIMIPLLITSFKCIRAKMSNSSWKKLHKLAYLFYALIWLHIAVLWIPSYPRHFTEVLLYSSIFVIYIILKIIKYTVWLKPSKNKQA